MKYKNLVLAVISLGLFVPKITFAFDSEKDCKKTLNYNVNGPLQNILNNYTDTTKYAKQQSDGTYTLCFNSTTPYCDPTKGQCGPYFITSKLDSNNNPIPLLIYGLNLSTTSDKTLLTLSGSNITLDHAILTGIGTGTGIKIDAKDIIINTATISKFATSVETTNNSENAMIKNVTISDGGIIFAGIGHKIESSTLTGTPPATGQAGIGTAMQVTGQNMAISGSKFSGFSNPISIADGADANMLGNSFEADIASANSINEYVKNLIKFEGAAGSYLDIAWIGKHISEADANYADRIAGKVDFICSNEIPACAGMTECAGTVEMLVLEITEKHDVVAYKQIAAELLTGDKAIGLKTKDDPADKPSKQIYPKQANAETGEITYAGDCHFDFKGINISLKQVIGFTFTNANKQTVQFLPPQALVSDMPDVIITAMPGATIPTTISGADGATVEDSTIFVTGYTAELPDTGAANADTASQDQKEPLIEWTNLGDGPKAKTDDATDSDGDGGQLSQRSGFTDGKVQASQGAGGACGANIAAAAPSAGGLVAQIILLFGSLPVVIERRRK